MTKRYLIWIAVSTRVQSAEDRQSLPIQERDGITFAEQQDGDVVDILRVPGHSRRDKDFNALAVRAARKGIDAFMRLEDHWKARDFDVLWVRGGDRFARSQSLFARIAEEVIDSGAVIYSQEDGGWIDKTNYRMWIAMVGAQAAGQVDKLVAQGRKTKDEKAALGLAVNARPIWCHKLIRNEYGKILQVVPDESKRLIIEDAARLVLEGVGWHAIEVELRARFGYTNGGKPFTNNFFYHLFHNPGFWGNSARRWRGTTTSNGRRVDLWVLDDRMPPPDKVLIYYHTHEPYLKGELAERVKDELARRRSTIRGGTRPYRTRRFSGLLICSGCGFVLTSVWNGKGIYYFRCPSRHSPKYARHCEVGQYVSQPKIQAWFDEQLRAMLAAHDPYTFAGATLGAAAQNDTAALQSRLEDVQARARRLIEKQGNADGALSSLYDEQIQACADEIKVLSARLLDARSHTHEHERQRAKAAYETIAAFPSTDAFWAQDDVTVNQTLHMLMGSRRVIYHEGEPLRVVTG